MSSRKILYFPHVVSRFCNIIKNMKNNELDDRAKRFSYYFGLELKGAITAQGYSQAKVAEALGHAKSAISNWLNAKPPISVDVAQKICEYIGVEQRVIAQRANKRVIDELGPWLPVTASMLSDEERQRRMDAKIDSGDFALAAMRDPNKRLEAEGIND